MTNIKFAENYFSFRSTIPTFQTTSQPLTPEIMALVYIESTLTDAHNAYLNGHYQYAIRLYQKASGMIYTHLNPDVPFGFLGVDTFLQIGFPTDRELFNPLLSAALEWMNLLPVRQPLTITHSRLPVNTNTLSTTDHLTKVGVMSENLMSGKAMNAAADLQLAQALVKAGNARAANFFFNRAETVDHDTIKTITATSNTLNTPTNSTVINPNNITANSISESFVNIRPTSSTRSINSSSKFLPDLNLATTNEIGTPVLDLPTVITEKRSLGTLIGGTLQTFNWPIGESPPILDIRKKIYEERVKITELSMLSPQRMLPSDMALQLPHDYFFVIPLGLGECYHALGEYDTAETFYLQAAGYEFLNIEIEASYIWQRLAHLYLDRGNLIYREDNITESSKYYQKIIKIDGSVPDSQLYTMESLKVGGNIAKVIINGLNNVDSLETNPEIIAIILEAHQQLIKIAGGLDYWGQWHNSVPIWTFDFLQSASINFTQLAMSSEKDVISFWDRQGQGNLTRAQLVGTVNQADAEVDVAKKQKTAAEKELDVYTQGKALADLRAENAKKNAEEYAAISEDQIVAQAVSTQLNGGDSGNAEELNRRADIRTGKRAPDVYTYLYYDEGGPTSYTITDDATSGTRGTLSATEQLIASRLNRQYEIDSLKRQQEELMNASIQADGEIEAAKARLAAAEASVKLANAHHSSAEHDLETFNQQFFTPEVWKRMGDKMYNLYKRYLSMAIDTARLMQRAFNFEMDESLDIIKTDYSTDEINGLLAAEMLMADIQSFTYELVTGQINKPQPLRQTISLSNRYGFNFETQFRKTGIMEFETRIDDFDMMYPGTYAGRIDALEVAIDGIIPPNGISGTLTNSGISGYRTPLSTGVESHLKYRIQSKETLVISDYIHRLDGPLISLDSRQTRIFQGAGVSSTWKLEIPKSINDIDYGALTDVRLTFYYKARYDPELQKSVLNQLATIPNINAGQRGIPLRWIYPDAFFNFQDTGSLDFSLKSADFRRNETNPVISEVGIIVITDGTVPKEDIQISVSTPSHTAIGGNCDIGGKISSVNNDLLKPLTGGTAIGDYRIVITAINNPMLVKDGKLNLASIVNIALILGYTYTPKLSE